jgi:biopolymer transport protein ExbD
MRIKREIPEINAGSMADIAFLLLIFFLVTTTMATDLGIPRKLPQKSDSPIPPPKIPDRNILIVLVNRNDKIMIEGDAVAIEEVYERVKTFIANPNDEINLPDKKVTQIPFFGEFPVSKQVISLRSDRGTSYGVYIAVQNEITHAYNSLRDELALEHFNCSFEALNSQKQTAVKKAYPMRISEAEPNF